MRAAFFTLGCKVNQYETAFLMQQFAAEGFDIVEPEDPADVYVINSCTVTAAGDQKSRQVLRRFRRQNPGAVICLTGCFPQAYPNAATRLPEADIITGASNRGALLGAVRARLAGGPRVTEIVPHRQDEPFEEMALHRHEQRTRAFVKIQDGCERFCAYCIIPTARGPLRSKQPQALRRELLGLAAAGYREVVLVGINLSCYGQDFGGALPDALRIACAVPGVERVRLGSLEPELLDTEAIAEMAALPGLCPQFHLSLQSGCDATLTRMRRHYTTGQYRRIARDLHAAFAGCAITTDIMVGFPGEDEREFEQSMAFVEEMGFARAHVFAYSPRAGTVAADMPDQVSAAEKHRRSERMLVIAGKSRQAFLSAQLGKELRVLIESQTPEGWTGYSENYTQVLVRSRRDLAGRIVTVRPFVAEPDRCVAEYGE